MRVFAPLPGDRPLSRRDVAIRAWKAHEIPTLTARCEDEMSPQTMK